MFPSKGSLAAAPRLNPEEPPGQMVPKKVVFFFLKTDAVHLNNRFYRETECTVES